MNNRKPCRKFNGSRRGSLLICVLACMVIVTGLLAIMQHQAVRSRSEFKQRITRLQLQRVLDAGILRCVQQLEANPEYAGELWQPEFSLLNQTSTASVKIEVSGEVANLTVSVGESPHQLSLSQSFQLSASS
ncbi:MAG: hypothetical protein AAF802_16800 [Planctomycetota bacterium]